MPALISNKWMRCRNPYTGSSQTPKLKTLCHTTPACIQRGVTGVGDYQDSRVRLRSEGERGGKRRARPQHQKATVMKANWEMALVRTRHVTGELSC